MRNYILVISLFFVHLNSHAQKNKADSLNALLAIETKDSNRVTLLWNIALASYAYNPDTSIQLAQKALYLARKIKFTEGESRALGIIANSFLKIGNYPRALEFYLAKLKLEEKRNNPLNLSGVIFNIGIVYVYQEEYRKALPYYYKADSLIRVNNLESLKYYIAVNLGDVYYKLHINDSAFLFFQKSLSIARAMNDESLLGSSMVGLGHTYVTNENSILAKQNYQEAVQHLLIANDEDHICEANLGLAKVFQMEEQPDSAEYYARNCLSMAYKDGFISWQLEAAHFLTEHYKKNHRNDSAFKYLELAQVLTDSINSKEKIRELQILSSNEQLRQAQITETLVRTKAERSQQLQLLFIGIFIPGLFLFTLFLSRQRVHVRVIKTMGIISLLMLFEYLTLLLHPRVLEMTNHTPVFEIMIFVCIAAILIPTHHRVEHWLIERLTSKQMNSASESIVLQTKKRATKKPATES